MRIQNVFRIDQDLVQVKVSMDAKVWSKAKTKGELGQLYGIDISNAVYHETGVKAYYPSVDHSRRAVDGLKVITLTYRDSEWVPAPDNVIGFDFASNRAPNACTDNVDNLIRVDFVARRKAA